MIRTFISEDLDYVMRIWLDANTQSHDFIDKQFWLRNFEFVKEVIPTSEVYVFENDGEIQAFVGLENGFIAGIFVAESVQSKGIGGQLLSKCKKLYTELSLHVYEKNKRATAFYLREGFIVEKRLINEQTQEPELLMRWKKKT